MDNFTKLFLMLLLFSISITNAQYQTFSSQIPKQQDSCGKYALECILQNHKFCDNFCSGGECPLSHYKDCQYLVDSQFKCYENLPKLCSNNCKLYIGPCKPRHYPVPHPKPYPICPKGPCPKFPICPKNECGPIISNLFSTFIIPASEAVNGSIFEFIIANNTATSGVICIDKLLFTTNCPQFNQGTAVVSIIFQSGSAMMPMNKTIDIQIVELPHPFRPVDFMSKLGKSAQLKPNDSIILKIELFHPWFDKDLIGSTEIIINKICSTIKSD